MRWVVLRVLAECWEVAQKLEFSGQLDNRMVRINVRLYQINQQQACRYLISGVFQASNCGILLRNKAERVIIRSS